MEISFGVSLVGRLFLECILPGISRYLFEEGESATAADNLGLRGISAFPPDSVVGREGDDIIVEGGLRLYYYSLTSASTTTTINEDADINVVSLEDSVLNALEANMIRGNYDIVSHLYVDCIRLI